MDTDSEEEETQKKVTMATAKVACTAGSAIARF